MTKSTTEIAQLAARHLGYVSMKQEQLYAAMEFLRENDCRTHGLREESLLQLFAVRV